MRIIAGMAKGKKLASNPSLNLRPLMDRIKESLFAILDQEGEGKKVLDLFAGSGSFGLEALSRGAAGCSFVEADPETAGLIRENLGRIGFTDQAAVYQKRAEDFLAGTGEKFDIIFIDPPFNKFKEVIKEIIDLIIDNGILSEEGLVIIRYFFKDTFETDKLQVRNEKRYGENQVTFYQLQKEES